MPQNLMGVVRLTANPTVIVARILPLDDRELFNPCWTKFQLGTGTQPALEIVLVTRPALPPQNFTRIFLYPVVASGTGPYYYPNKFPDPGNWNPINKVEVVGSGQQGHPSGSPVLATEAPGPLVPIAGLGGGGGGGGGAYAHAENIPVTFPVDYTVFWGSTVGTTGMVCVWGSNTWNHPMTGPGIVYAGIAAGGQYSSPGSGGPYFYPAGFAGGNGGNGYFEGNGGGGGGAAGPAGAGANATNATSTTFGNGGSANAGTSAGGTTGGAAGVSGIEWGSIAGVGGGGAGGIVAGNGGAGGPYGGGGGGGGGGSGGSTTGGRGGDGLIVITYVPLPSGMQAQILG